MYAEDRIEKMSIEELIKEYEKSAEKVRTRITEVREMMKADPDRSKAAMYRRRIETLYDEYGDTMYVIEQLLPHLRRERELKALREERICRENA